MALHLKTFGTRALTAVVFVALFLGSVLLNYYTFTLFFFAVSLIGLVEFYKLAEHLAAHPFKKLGVVLGGLTYLLAVNWTYLGLYVPNIETKAFYVLIFIVLVAALFNKSEDTFRDALFTVGGIFYAVVPFALLHGIVFSELTPTPTQVYSPSLLLGIIFLIWSNDTFAYIGGSFFGKHKLFSRISPGKTWEGTIFGIVLSFGLSFLIRDYLDDLHRTSWPLLGLFIPVLATLGDLIESMLKRQAKVKDSGSLMPGHGGVLDRFDSLIFVSPLVAAIAPLL